MDILNKIFSVSYEYTVKEWVITELTIHLDFSRLSPTQFQSHSSGPARTKERKTCLCLSIPVWNNIYLHIYKATAI